MVSELEINRRKKLLGSRGNSRLFGVEIEAEATNYEMAATGRKLVTKHPLVQSVHDDGSLDMHGIEISSNPFTYDWIRKNASQVEDLLERLKELSFKTSYRCGLHVHFGKQLMSEKAKRNVLEFFSKIPNHEWMHKFSKRATVSHYAFYNTNKSMHEGHSSALNTITRLPTWEIRIFQGTLDMVDMIGAVSFVKELIRFANTRCQENMTHEKFVDSIHKSRDRWAAEFIVKRALSAGFKDESMQLEEKDRFPKKKVTWPQRDNLALAA